MNLFRSYSYARLEKEDPDDRQHRRAQFLIYKVLKQAECRRRQSLPGMVISRFKIKVGRRLKKLRRSGVCVREKFVRQLKHWKQAVALTPVFS